MSERLLVSELKLEKFRSFTDVIIPLGRKITVISGVNGVGKSNLLSLIASGSGMNKKSQLANNFQPEFTDFFNIDINEPFSDYKLYIKYIKENGDFGIARRLSFKDDTKANRGIRIIPRTTNVYCDELTNSEMAEIDKNNYDVGGSARVKIPTIFSSLSRLYPLGEKSDSVKINRMRKNNMLIQKAVMDKFRSWYNHVIPGAISPSEEMSIVNKETCSRASLYMNIKNTPVLSQSVGQDNIGNIISALADLYLLSLEENYCGALLCIDEIEVSLHPNTQIRMLDLLDKLSDELKIQVIVSTHSLTVLKECLRKENKNSDNFKVIYLKDPYAPMLTGIKNYDMLKADMFGQLSFNSLQVKMYFEDNIGQTLFEQLIKAYKSIYFSISNRSSGTFLRNSDLYDKKNEVDKEILDLSKILEYETKLNKIVTHLGCENLINISKADNYFKRVIIMLDGDARIKEDTNKPKAKDYMNSDYDKKKLRINDRQHEKNIIFAPGYFAPESYLYRIIMKICQEPLVHSTFWRGLDEKESTALYTADKVKNLFNNIRDDFSNDDLKKVFSEEIESDIWKFILESSILEYYYSDYETVHELLEFLKNFDEAYKITSSLTFSNRYI